MKKKEITLADLKKSSNPALQRIAEKVEQEMNSSSYTSHTSHYSSSNAKKEDSAK